MYIVYSIGFLSHLTDLYHKVPVYDIVQWNFSLSPFFIFYFFLNTNKEVGVRGTRWQSENINFVVISNKLPRACRQYLDRSFLISFTRGKKKKERKKKRDKTLHLFVSSPSTFHRPPIIHLSFEILKRLLSSFFSRGRFSFGISD